MKLVSPCESDAAALAIKFDECRRKHWKMLKLPEPKVVPPEQNMASRYYNIQAEMQANVAYQQRALYNNQSALDGKQ